MVTTDASANIEAKPYWESLKLDGVDVNIIQVKITDNKGRLVPEATNNVKVEVFGSAKLLAIDTGNLFYKGNFKTDKRDAANGYMTVTVQSVKGNAPVMVKLTSDGLNTAEVKM